MTHLEQHGVVRVFHGDGDAAYDVAAAYGHARYARLAFVVVFFHFRVFYVLGNKALLVVS